MRIVFINDAPLKIVNRILRGAVVQTKREKTAKKTKLHTQILIRFGCAFVFTTNKNGIEAHLAVLFLKIQ